MSQKMLLRLFNAYVRRYDLAERALIAWGQAGGPRGKETAMERYRKHSEIAEGLEADIRALLEPESSE